MRTRNAGFAESEQNGKSRLLPSEMSMHWRYTNRMNDVYTSSWCLVARLNRSTPTPCRRSVRGISCLLPRASMNKGTASSYRAREQSGARQVEGSPCRISRQGKRYLSYLLFATSSSSFAAHFPILFISSLGCCGASSARSIGPPARPKIY